MNNYITNNDNIVNYKNFMEELDNLTNEYYPMKDTRDKSVKGVSLRTGKTVKCIDFFYLKENDNKLYSDNGKYILKNAKRCDICMSRQCMDCIPRKNLKVKAKRDNLMEIRYNKA